jgi:hypothetical protein
MQIKAKIIELLEPQTGSGKNGTWKKQYVILETFGEFPKKVCVTIWGDKITAAILKIGNEVEAFLDLESREFNGKWYTDVKVWKMEVLFENKNQTTTSTDLPSATPDDFLSPNSTFDDELPPF